MSQLEDAAEAYRQADLELYLAKCEATDKWREAEIARRRSEDAETRLQDAKHRFLEIGRMEAGERDAAQ